MGAVLVQWRRFRAGLVKALEWLIIAAFVVLTLDVLWGVFSRYVVGEQSRWTEELAIYLLVWVSLIGASLTYAEKGHLGVDYFVGKMDPSARRVGAIAVELLVLAFSVFVLLYGGWILITKTLATGQVTPALGIKMGYMYLAAPISGFFFTLFCLENLVGLLRGDDERAPKAPQTDS
jgi:TRAP-type C4-dicarboxylate transport system permease small subunit